MIIPPKLKAGDEVRVIAPSCTLPCAYEMDKDFFERAKEHFRLRGYEVSEGNYLREVQSLESASIEHRIDDLHAAFRDPNVRLISCIRGGWNCNQLLSSLDYELIRNNPKILCGFSDITALSNAIYTKTGLLSYSGPNFRQFGLGDQLQYTFDAFDSCLTKEDPIIVEPSKQWSDDKPKPDHQTLQFERNEGYWTLQEGEAEGTLLGGNLCTFVLLHGTEYMPDLAGSILFLEDDYETHPRLFERQLQSILHQPGFTGVRGIVIGRFEKIVANAHMQPITRETLTGIIETKKELRRLPIIANVDFGHTYPAITFPIGGRVRMKAAEGEVKIEIVMH